MLYLISTPGVLAGMIDMYLVSPIQRYLEPNFRYSVDDLEIGKLIAEGGFGEVYRATLIGKKETRDVIVKRAKEFGRPEVWMNERMQRTAPSVIAEYITAFSEVRCLVVVVVVFVRLTYQPNKSRTDFTPPSIDP